MTAIYSLFEQTMVLIEQTLNKSEEQLIKDIDAERKLKLLFSGLQHKLIIKKH